MLLALARLSPSDEKIILNVRDIHGLLQFTVLQFSLIRFSGERRSTNHFLRISSVSLKRQLLQGMIYIAAEEQFDRASPFKFNYTRFHPRSQVLARIIALITRATLETRVCTYDRSFIAAKRIAVGVRRATQASPVALLAFPVPPTRAVVLRRNKTATNLPAKGQASADPARCAPVHR